MLNRSEILSSAWADYRRDAKMGWGVDRNGSFCRTHFAYCLRMAWAVAKSRAAVAAAPTPVLPAPRALTPVVMARAAEVRSELLWMEMGDFIDWNRHRDLSAELSRLGA